MELFQRNGLIDFFACQSQSCSLEAFFIKTKIKNKLSKHKILLKRLKIDSYTILDKTVFSFSAIMLTSNKDLNDGSSKQGKHFRASAGFLFCQK
jgi:hypothetical protein